TARRWSCSTFVPSRTSAAPRGTSRDRSTRRSTPSSASCRSCCRIRTRPCSCTERRPPTARSPRSCSASPASATSCTWKAESKAGLNGGIGRLMRSNMKRLSLGFFLALFPLFAFAQRADLTTLRAYAAKAMPRCAGTVITLDQLPNAGPAGFVPYKLTHTSTDKSCGSETYLLSSPPSQQVFIGTVFPLAADARPATDRIAEVVIERLKTPVQVTIAPFPLPDGLRAVSMAHETPYGNFAYHGFIDQS